MTALPAPPPGLFSPFTLRGVTLRNRIGISAMAQFSAVDGQATDWHLVHLGSRAVGGAGLVMTESTAVLPNGRNSPFDLGLWSDAQVPGQRRLVEFLRAAGAVPGCQLAHGGRKAGRQAPWLAGAPAAQDPALAPVGPDAIAFDARSPVPLPLDLAGIDGVVRAFSQAAERACAAGYPWIEVHAAHGYLLHSFLSPLSNQRNDAYGGPLENRCRLARRVARELRQVLGDERVLAFRLSFTDWEDGGWQPQDTVQLARWLKEDGVDLIDVSSGGSTPAPRIPLGPGYQLQGAAQVRREAGLPVAAVGLFVSPQQAEQALYLGEADLVLFARQALRDPYLALHAAEALQQADLCEVPVQYRLAHPGGAYRWREYAEPPHRRLQEA